MFPVPKATRSRPNSHLHTGDASPPGPPSHALAARANRTSGDEPPSVGSVFASAAQSSVRPAESRSNRDILVRAHYEIFEKGNLDFVDEVFAENYVVHGVTGDRVGREQVKETAASIRESFPDLRVELKSVVAEGDLVAWQRDSHGTHTKQHAGVAPSGQFVSWQTFVISRFENGRIVEESGATNVASALMAAHHRGPQS